MLIFLYLTFSVTYFSFRRKMNFLLRKRINNRRWFLRKKAKGASMNEQMDVEKNMDKTPSPQSTPSAQLRDYFNPIMAAALQAQQQQVSRPATGPLIGGTQMVDTKVDLTVS